MVDKPLILRKLTELDEYLKQMEEFSSGTREEHSKSLMMIKKDWILSQQKQEKNC